MRSIRWIAITFLAMATTGCSTTNVALDLRSVGKTVEPCYKALRENPKYALIHKKLAVDLVGEPTKEQLADPERITPEGIQVGMEWFEEYQQCNVERINAFSNFDPVLGEKVASWQTEVIDTYIDVITNSPSYGHINTRIQRGYERRKIDLREYINNEAQRRSAETQQMVSDGVSAALDLAITVLQAREANFAHAQRIYALHTPKYHSVDITKTVCTASNKKFSCKRVEIKED